MKSVNYHCGANIRQFALAAIFALIVLAWGAVAQAAPNQQSAPAAVGTTFSVSSPACSGPGTLHQAIEDANNSPGNDTINFLPVITQISVCKVNLSDSYWTNITESVDIVGNGVTLYGGQRIYTDDGKINPLICPSSTAGVTVVSDAPELLEIGTFAGAAAASQST